MVMKSLGCTGRCFLGVNHIKTKSEGLRVRSSVFRSFGKLLAVYATSLKTFLGIFTWYIRISVGHRSFWLFMLQAWKRFWEYLRDTLESLLGTVASSN